MSPAKKKTADLKRLAFTTRAAWRQWLTRNHGRSSGVWLQFQRKSSGKPSLAYTAAVEEALCFGWIDSIVKSLGADGYVQLFTPRKAKSPWARSNKERVSRLLSAGLMRPAGLAAIQTAKANGSWTALDSVEALEVPDDLKRALVRNPLARRNFELLSPSRKKQLLYLVTGAKREETRRKRIDLAVEVAAGRRKL